MIYLICDVRRIYRWTGLQDPCYLFYRIIAYVSTDCTVYI